MAWLLDTNILSELRRLKPEPRVLAFVAAHPLDELLPITEDIMLRWRLVVEEGRKVGHTFSQPDLIIAATALHHGLTMVTRDRRDFDRAGVAVVNPWDAGTIE
jgi:predicted nucleic acid-binding protein